MPPNSNTNPNPNPNTIQLNGPANPPYNTNETVYFIRHAEAHPSKSFDNGNYVCQGHWRALSAPPALLKQLGGTPDYIYSSDPSEAYGGYSRETLTYVRPALTLNPFSIANNADALPLNLVTPTQAMWNNPQGLINFLFTEKQFAGKRVLVAWEHKNIEAAVSILVNAYKYPYGLPLPTWNSQDYDSIWRVSLDGSGNLTVIGGCEGLTSENVSLPVYCP